MRKKILVVGHNVFSKTDNMGKTLASYFENWRPEELAQFYIHTEVPTDCVCLNYYRVTDKDVLKSIITRKSGSVLGENDIQEGRASSRTDVGLTAAIYQKSRKRTPFVYFMRNLIWRLGKWNTKKLRVWVDEFAPDAVFFPAGDYGFMYDVALKIAQYKKIPLFVCCMDDLYFNNKNEKKFGGKLAHKIFMRQVKKTMKYASCVFTICDKMAADYSKLFDKPCYTLHTGSSFSGPLVASKKTNRISYIGNVGYCRNLQLIDIGRALLKIDCDGKPEAIDVYSPEPRPEILCNFTPENGIRFCGQIDAEQVKKVTAESMLVIHTESFDEISRKAVAYSVSTKIADLLASGTCVLAYGPSEIASMKYLKDNDSALCIESRDALEDGLKTIVSDETLRERIANAALELANKNHDRRRVCETIANAMERYWQ